MNTLRAIVTLLPSSTVFCLGLTGLFARQTELVWIGWVISSVALPWLIVMTIRVVQDFALVTSARGFEPVMKESGG